MLHLDENIVREVRKSNCFDFLRYLFAFSLIISHYSTLTGTPQLWFITGSMRVKAFFCITGFLVTYSFLRRGCDIRSYAVKRFVRIVPAYVVTILFCLALGCCVTTLPFADFVAHPQTFAYGIANLLMLNWLQPCLPGVFEANVMSAVNGSLWTMKVETAFYVLVPVLVWFAARAGRASLTLTLMTASVAAYNVLPVQLQYFTFFFGGMTILLFYDRFCRHSTILMILATLCETLLYTDLFPHIHPLLQAAEPLTFPCMLIYMAYHLPMLNLIRRYDNITYGLFLYHFPVAQVFVSYGWAAEHFWLSFAAVTLVTSLLAMLSWRLIEQPLINRYK